MSTTSSPIEQVLEVARAALLARRATAAARVERIKQAADAYLQAIDSEFAAQFAVQNGLEFKSEAAIVRAALELKAAIEAVPEANVAVETPASAAPSPTAPAPVTTTPPVAVTVAPPAATTPTPTVTPPPAVTVSPPAPTPAPAATPSVSVRPGARQTVERTEVALGPLIDALQKDIRATSFDELNDDIFRTYMEEFAARARFVQDHCVGHPGEEEMIGKVIRRLTAMVGERGMSGIYGLARSHSADWQQRANEAVRKRERLQNPSSAARAGSLTQKMKLPESVREQAPAAEDEEEDEAMLDLPALRGASDRGPVVVVGGGVRNDKLEKIRRRSGLDFEWVAIESDGMRAIDTLERRVRDGRLRALIVLQELMGHKHFEPLVTAARQVGLPFAYGGKAGKAALDKALREIETLMAQRLLVSAQ